MGNVNYKIVGNADDAVKAVDKLRSQFEKLEMKLKDQAKYSRQNKAATQESMAAQTQFVKSMVVEIFSLQGAWNMARKAFDEYTAANQRVQDLRGAAAVNSRETEIKIKNQGQFNDAETKQTLANIDREATTIPVSDVTDAKRMTEEALSQGFDRQEVINGEVLRAFLELKAATNQYGAGATDSKELVKSLATSIRNTEGRDPKQAMSAEEIRSFGEAFHSLFLTQSIQLQDAIPFARIQAILTARGIDNKTQLAAFSVAVDAFGGGDVAATYLQQATAYMGRAGSDKMKKKLDKLGIEIDGTKFDLIGEDLVEALRNMGTALNGLQPREKADALDALFGTKAQAGALTLMGKADLVEQSRTKIEKATEGGGYQQAYENFQQSPQASSQKKTNVAEIASIEGLKSQQDMTMEDVQAVLDKTFAELKKKGESTANLTIDKMFADYYNWLTGSNQTPYELLQSIQVKSNDRAQYNIDNNRPNTDANGTARILNEQIDAADPRNDRMNVIAERLRREAAAAGVETAADLPEARAANNAAPDQWRVDLWDQYEAEKRKIEERVRQEQAGWIWNGSEATIQNQIDVASQPLYEQYKQKADAGPKAAQPAVELPPLELPRPPEPKPPAERRKEFTVAEMEYLQAADDIGNGTTRQRSLRLSEADRNLNQEIPVGVDEEEYKRQLIKQRNEQLASPVTELKIPDNMQVSDPNAQASLEKINITMEAVLAVLSQPPDRSRQIKLPRSTSQSGTA